MRRIGSISLQQDLELVELEGGEVGGMRPSPQSARDFETKLINH
jgi:hypothetical protein